MTTTIQPSRLKNPVQVAWGILLLAFAIFCTIALFTIIAVHYYFFLSTVPMDVTVASVRGGVSYTPLDLNERTVGESPQVLNIGNVVEPNPQSQGIITFRDPYQNGQVVATISLDNSNSSMTLRSAVRPRFDWGDARFLIEAERVNGDIEVQVSEGYDSSNFLLLLETTQGTSIRVSSSGKATVRVTDGLTEVINERGEVVLLDRSLPAKSIPRGHIGRIRTGQPNIEVVQNPLINLVQNSTFSEELFLVEENRNYPDIWRCGNVPGSAPSGMISTTQAEGRQALQLVRGPTETHGETYCEQGVIPSEDVSPNWIDVRNYNYLSLKTSFFINYQSLNRCGQQGSECPLMVRIDYVAPPLEEGEEPRSLALIYGFYAVNNLNPLPIDCSGIPDCIQPADWPYFCQSCKQEHIFIREKQWYTYSTGNILPTLQFKPEYITNVRLYASGHQYDVRVSELSLFAGNLSNAGEIVATTGQTATVNQ
jgi:phosphotransferase system HPr-like phosphotransfer protein